MMFTSLALLSGVVLFSNAAPYYPYSVYSPRAPPPVTHSVNVSNDTAGLLFDPPYITAAAGDNIKFKFRIKNHTVTQSSFDAPCTPLHNGADSGFVPVTPGTQDKDLPIYEFLVVDANPIWIHCRQAANTAASHCGKGMVFAVNPGNDALFAAFRNKAFATGNQLSSKNTAQSASEGSNQSASNGTHHSASNSTHHSASNGTHHSASNGTHHSASNGTHQSVSNSTHHSAPNTNQGVSNSTNQSASNSTYQSASNSTNQSASNTNQSASNSTNQPISSTNQSTSSTNQSTSSTNQSTSSTNQSASNVVTNDQTG